MKKIAILLAALAGFAGFSASTSAQQSVSSYSVTTDFSYTSQYVIRGIQRVRGDAFTPSVEGAIGNSYQNGYLGLWTMQPITRYQGDHQNNEIDIYAGYKQKLTRVLSAEVVGTYYWYPEAAGGQTRNTYELGLGLTYASRGITASVYGYYDFRLQAMTGVGLVGYSFPIAKLGASIDVDFYIGTAGSRNWMPDMEGDKVRQSYNYYGFDMNVPYHITENATVSAGLHYATNQNTPDGTPVNKLWFTLGVTTRFYFLISCFRRKPDAVELAFLEKVIMPAGAAAVPTNGPDIPAGPATPAQRPADSHGSARSLLTRALIEFAQAWAWLFNLLQNKNVFYSLKTFGAAMLAIFIAFSLDLTQPGWAFMTVYIVSQPYSGMVLSKSLARIVGTLVGAVMSVVLVALFHNVPPLFVLSVALWIGACLYFSIYMRDAPGAYGAMLSGYTAAIIGFSSISNPNAIFDTVTGRCLEIILAICVATLVSRVVLPRSSGRVFRYRVASSLADMKRCITGILGGHYDDTRGLVDLRKLLTDGLALESLRVHASRDTAGVREAGDLVRGIQGRILSLSSLLVSLHDRLVLLRKERPAAAAQFEPLFKRVAERIESIAEAAKPTPAMLAGTAASPTQAATRLPKPAPNAPSITTELLARLPDFESVKRDPELVLEYNIILRLIDILAQWQEVNRLGALLFSDNLAGATNIPAPPPEDTQITNYRDHSLALVSAIGAIISVAGVTAFWIWTGWPNGASAATFAGVVACTTATQDDPASRAMRTLRGSLLAALWSIIFLYAVLPHLDTFDGLVAVLALIYVPAGILIPNPRYGTIVYIALIYGASFMGLHNLMEPNFADTINSNAALITGMLAAIIGFRLLRPAGTEWPLRRHTAGMFRDIANLATMTGPINRSLFETRMLDRTNAVMLRLRLDNPDERERLRGVLTATRVGLNIRYLARLEPDMPPPLATAVRDALNALAEHCDQLARHPNATPAESPLPALDRAIHRALDAGPGERDQTLNILVSLRAIRNTLTQHEKFYRVPQPRKTTNPFTAKPASC